MKLIYFKKIELRDKNLIYNWRTKHFVKKFLQKKTIDRSKHDKWFKKKLRSKKFSAWTIIYNGNKIGLIQVDSLRKKKICNAGYYIAYTRYSYLTYEIMINLHNFIFNELNFNIIESYISIFNKNIRKLNKMNGYKEVKKEKTNEVFLKTFLTKKLWEKSTAFKKLKKKDGKI